MLGEKSWGIRCLKCHGGVPVCSPFPGTPAWRGMGGGNPLFRLQMVLSACRTRVLSPWGTPDEKDWVCL